MEYLGIVSGLVSISFALIAIASLLFGINGELRGIKTALQQLDEPPVREKTKK